MINSEVIYSVKEQTDKHDISDNTGWSDEHIYFYLIRARATLLYRKITQYGKSSSQNEMSTPCLKLIPAENCPCIPPKGCTILMTEKTLPQSISGIISVSNVDGDQEYKKTSSEQVKHRATQRKSAFADNISWFELDTGSGTRIFIVTKKPLQYIKSKFIPENPEELQRMCDCEGNNQYECTPTYDLDWKLDPELTHAAIDLAINNLLRSRSQLTDVKNNNMDDNVGNRQEIIGNTS